MKKYFLVLLCLCLSIVMFSGCASQTAPTKEKETVEKEEESSEAFTLSDATANKENKISFEEANILEYKLETRDDAYSDDSIEVVFVITNTGEKPVDYLSTDYLYVDSEGNEICEDGRYLDCQIAPGKTAIQKTYGDLDDRDKSEVKNIEVTSYEYIVDGKEYEVNLQTEKVQVYNLDDENNVDFDEVNILSFELTDKGADSSGDYEVEVRTTNNSDMQVSYMSFDMGYFDENSNYLGHDGRYNDNVINPGKSVVNSSFYFGNDDYPTAKYGVYAYEYKLTEPDKNGFNSYEINLQTKTAEGSLDDDD